MQGAAPALIQWNTPAHPAVAMPDFEGKLSPHALPVGATPYLLAHIQTPDGPRKLDCNMY